ncbi:MAG: hypothetical protein LBO72_07575 [Helicobacteraceae bacterium]|nr:hypothetical protein [Helicobacteraceae bacterium]
MDSATTRRTTQASGAGTGDRDALFGAALRFAASDRESKARGKRGRGFC